MFSKHGSLSDIKYTSQFGNKKLIKGKVKSRKTVVPKREECGESLWRPV